MATPDQDEPLLITGLDAATRQLETAITLYFHEGDPVSIHTLACAAHEVIDRINRKSEREPGVVTAFEAQIKPDFVKEFKRIVREAQNFFKHADDPRATVKLVRFTTTVNLLDACLLYRRLTGENRPLMAMFVVWSAVTWAKDVLDYPQVDRSSLRDEATRLKTRTGFFAEYYPLLISQLTGHRPK